MRKWRPWHAVLERDAGIIPGTLCNNPRGGGFGPSRGFSRHSGSLHRLGYRPVKGPCPKPPLALGFLLNQDRPVVDKFLETARYTASADNS